MSLLPPLPPPGRAGAFAALVLIESRRALRGWRWRVLAIATPFAAWWLNRGDGFGPGASVHFPGGPDAMMPFVVLVAAAAAILGIDAIACWERGRSGALLQQALERPMAQLFASAISIVALLGPLMALYILWPTIGVWRAGGSPLLGPSFAFMIFVSLPFCLLGVASGLLARVVMRHDALAMLIAGGLLTAPLLAQSMAAPSDLLTLASPRLGILLPVNLILRDALVYTALAGGMLLLASSMIRTIRIDEAGGKSRSFLMMLRTHTKLGGGVHVASLAGLFLVLTIGIVGFGPAVRSVLPNSEALPLSSAPAFILERRITMSKDAPLQVTLVYTSDSTDTLAFTFGPALTVEDASAGSWSVSDVRGFGEVLLVEPGESAPLEVTLTPRPGSRLWATSWHPAIHRFGALGPWWGEPVWLSSDGPEVHEAPSVYTVVVPKVPLLEWTCGAALISELGETVSVRADHPGLPTSLVAAPYQEFCAETDHLDLCARLLDSRGTFGSQFLRLYSEEIGRLGRAFPQKASIYLYEVPEQSPTDPLAIPSAQLDRLPLLLPMLEDYENPSRPEFVRFFQPIHRAAVRQLHTSRFRRIDSPGLLSEGLVEYLHRYAYAEGAHGGLMASTRRDLAFVPWRPIPNLRRPFDLGKAQSEVWREEYSDTNGAHRLRALALHHMLRGLLGEDRYLAFLRSLDGHEELTIALFQQKASEAHGSSLDWFFEQWLEGTELPEYAVREGDALLIRDRETRALNYRISIIAENRGGARMPVPWRLQTEGDPLSGTIELGPGGSGTLTLTTLDRPVVFELDPDGWVAQLVPPGSRDTPMQARLFFKTIREL